MFCGLLTRLDARSCLRRHFFGRPWAKSLVLSALWLGFFQGPKVVREEDGLELGNVYEFQVRVGDVCRMGPWSKSSPPVRFALSPPVPCEGGGLRILEKGDRAEVSWAPFQPDAASQAQLPNLSRLPIEYTLSIFADDEGAASDSAETRRETRLVSSLSTTSTVCSVSNLRPLSAYSASLSARWSRFGNVESGSTAARAARLFAAFATTGLKGSKLTAELSVRLPAGSNDFHKVGAPTRASIPMEGTGVPAAVTLDLDPYYAQPRLNHYKPEFVRKPSLPSSRRTQAQDDSPEERPLSPKQPTLPRVLVPMPPPKFTTRDPLSFALLQPKPPRPTATPRSARGAASSSAFRAEQC
ncbi:GIP [Symbiodinium sp. CCMP2592]|nr:GIP [Symbiodinium sp. CCMP2592]